MKFKYKIGDKVLIKKYNFPIDDPRYIRGFIPYMVEKYKGKILTIKSRLYNYDMPIYLIKEDTNGFYWTEEMFDDISDEL